ncbi:F0F1 ATP synthase subunit epsilon [Dehalogenimonas alkenigignens]|uniref:ATP synthase epsilon chain n=1 Tax=Dehalogenimonas alkenigignens TaxID=1217799 RepID=A0A0W0GJA5_9CHLR|nr:F0F1 ATP synthase subunit epsilon [Dehalogenimonas alkenigignens]KTB48625.1 ATP synthase F1 subcomplex epsilon subunit [Dehalogenimonas alkenigignens]PVV84940.1 F0F1 ATP synthase subunit epsilon [Dehalogenimonas alkenigignens]
MATIRLEVVTPERSVFSDDVDIVVAPGIEGELGILPHHTPLMTALKTGELRARKGSEEFLLCVAGGFMEVRPDRVIVLADTCERAEEIDLARAEEARRKAEQRMAEKYQPGFDAAESEAALHRAMARLAIAEKSKRRKGSLRPPPAN